MRSIRKALLSASIPLVFAVGAAHAQSSRIRVDGELVDTWCSVTGIMFAQGTAHHQCAVWCAAGGIPVSIRTKGGDYYMVLRIADESDNVANPRFVKIQSHEVSVDGELVERDGVKYLFVSQVLDDQGVVNLTHEENGIQPFGN
jgi:hypothetical protein